MKEFFEARFNAFMEYLKEMTDGFSTIGIITEVVDIILFIGIIILVIYSLRLRFKKKKLLLIVIIALLLFALAYFLNLTLMQFLIKYLAFWILGLILIIYNQEIRRMFDKNLHESVSNKAFSSEGEKKRVIDILVNTAVYLSERKTGALITVEGKESLDPMIEKSIIINSDVSLEMLSTLFYVGTVTHDGGVIIRGSTIKCAGALYPTTNRYDIPKNLGTRHRAAIGMSEHCDGVTIVVSEETGNISLTYHGGIEIAISPEKLRELLDQYIVKK